MAIADFLTLAGLTPIVAVFVELVKRTLALGENQTSRFGPALSVGSGIGLSLAAAGWLASQGQIVDVGQAVLTGALAGFASAGLYDLVGSPAGTLVERATGGRLT